MTLVSLKVVEKAYLNHEWNQSLSDVTVPRYGEMCAEVSWGMTKPLGRPISDQGRQNLRKAYTDQMRRQCFVHYSDITLLNIELVYCFRPLGGPSLSCGMSGIAHSPCVR